MRTGKWIYNIDNIHFIHYIYIYLYCDTSDGTDTLSLETMLSSISNKR